MTDNAASKKGVILFFTDNGEAGDRILPPLPVMALGAYIEEKGYTPHLIDARCEKDAYKEALGLMKDCICIGLSSLTGPQIASGLKISKMVREADPNFPIIWGGWHPSILPEQTCENEYVDAVIVGQGEITLLEVLQRIENSAGHKAPQAQKVKTIQRAFRQVD